MSLLSSKRLRIPSHRHRGKEEANSAWKRPVSRLYSRWRVALWAVSWTKIWLATWLCPKSHLLATYKITLNSWRLRTSKRKSTLILAPTSTAIKRTSSRLRLVCWRKTLTLTRVLIDSSVMTRFRIKLTVFKLALKSYLVRMRPHRPCKLRNWPTWARLETSTSRGLGLIWTVTLRFANHSLTQFSRVRMQTSMFHRLLWSQTWGQIKTQTILVAYRPALTLRFLQRSHLSKET